VKQWVAFVEFLKRLFGSKKKKESPLEIAARIAPPTVSIDSLEPPTGFVLAREIPPDPWTDECGHCLFFFREDSARKDGGSCRRYPRPELVSSHHWCGEYRADRSPPAGYQPLPGETK
jgi:hypothetical protein